MSNVHTVGIRIDVNASSVQPQTQAAAQAFTQMGAQAQQAGAALDGMAASAGSALTQVGAQAQHAQKALTDLGAQAQNAGRQAEAAMARVGNSAKQTQAAMRMLPAQMTDIGVGLATGQSPFMVLMQQGGQLKDMFGGIGPALRAVGGHVMGLLNPFTLAAAAVGAVGLAYMQGSREAEAYSRAIILSGNAAGTTSGQLQVMAQHISAVSGTQSAAANALAQMAGSGEVASANLEAFTSTALAMEREVGQAVSDTVEQFAALGTSPVEASIKLNEKYHYLTASVYEQIKALEEQGRVQEAGEVAQRAYADAMDRRTAQLQANLGAMERGWRAVTGAAKSAWDAMLNVGREAGTDSKLADVSAKLAAAEKAPQGYIGGAGGGDVVLKQLREQKAALEEVSRMEKKLAHEAADRAKQTDTITRWDKEGDQFKTRAAKREEAINKTRIEGQYLVNSGLIKQQQLEERIADIREKYKDPKGPKAPKAHAPKAYQDDAAERMLQKLREQNAAATAQARSEEKLTAAQKQQAEFTQLIADLKTKKILTADQKSLLAGADRIQAQLKENVLAEQQLKTKNEQVEAEKKRAAALERYNQAMEGIAASMHSAEQARGEQYERALGLIGKGGKAREREDGTNGIRREYRRYEDQLNKSAAKEGTLGSEKYQQDLQTIRAGLNESLTAHAAYYEELDKKQGDWSNGASEAMQNYADSAKDVAGQTKGVFDNAFKGMEDALTSFVTTGKVDFKKLADSIIADMARMAIKAAMSNVMGNLMGDSKGGGGGGGGSSWIGLVGSVVGSLFGIASAKGNVFDAPGLHAYANTIVDTPTVFPFAKGGVGLMGEAGPEAIMPLRRRPDGRLGVAAEGGMGGGGALHFAPQTSFYIDSRSDRGAVMADVGRVLGENNRAQMEQLKRMRVVPQ